MKTVGELFASGEMQLPFVLGSAETMKTAVAYLEPHMEKADQGGKGVMVLATVKGDVHDIGKNLVDIILTNNGYTVKNLGIKVGIVDMVSALEETGADAIGMSGLLVKSTLIMRENLEELNRRNLSHIPVILGGAALTRTYVERDLRKVYDGRLFYGKDAFEGLRTMDRLVELTKSGEDDPEFGTAIGGRDLGPRKSELRKQAAAEAPARGETLPSRSPEVATDNPTFKPPFLGSRVAKGMAIDDIAAYLNETALFRNQWGFRPENGEDDASFKERVRGTAARPAGHGQGRAAPGAPGGLGPLRGQRRRGRPGHLRGREPDQRVDAVHLPPPDRGSLAVHQRLLPPDRLRGARLGQLPGGDHGVTGRPRRRPGCWPTTSTRTTSTSTGWGSRWPKPWPSTGTTGSGRSSGFADQDGPNLTGLFRQKYRGGRYSWGYPACPDLEDNAKVVELLGADRIGIEVSEGFQLHPEQSTTAIICHHPQAKYFVA